MCVCYIYIYDNIRKYSIYSIQIIPAREPKQCGGVGG